MFGFSRARLGCTPVTLIVFTILCLSPWPGLWGTSEAKAEQKEHEKCRALYQKLSDSPMHSPIAATSAPSGSIEVCGASPSCGSCKTMRPGDCSYVFPSNVLVYPRKKNGYEEICACTVFACSLPWDPAGWNKKCMRELGCYEKPPHHGIGEFPAALCGSAGNYIKFGPRAFSDQSYSKPGMTVYEYEKNRQVSAKPCEISNIKYGSPDQESQCVFTNETRHTTCDGHNKYNDSKDRVYNYLAYRNNGAICIRNYGQKEIRATNDFVESCFPCPSLDLPVFYAVPYTRIVSHILKNSKYTRDRYQSVQYRAAAQKGVRSRTVEDKNIIETFNKNCNMASKHILRANLRMDFNEDPSEQGPEEVPRIAIAPQPVEYQKHGKNDQGGECSFESKLSPPAQYKHAFSGITAFQGFPARGVVSKTTSRPYAHVVNFSKLPEEKMCRFAPKHKEIAYLDGANSRSDHSTANTGTSDESQSCQWQKIGYEGDDRHYKGAVVCADPEVVGEDKTNFAFI